MYTLQSGQIENALRLGGAGDSSAKEMVQGLANCQQVLEHRSNVNLSKPAVNYFPTYQPAGNSPTFPLINNNITVKIPPWQYKEWEPIPFVPMPPWQTLQYPEWPDWPWQELLPPGDGTSRTGDVDGGAVGAFPPAAGGGSPGKGATGIPGGGIGGPALTAPSGATLGPTIIQQITAGPINAVAIAIHNNAQIGGALRVDGHAHIGGDLDVQDDLTVGGSTTLDGPVYMTGPIFLGNSKLSPMSVPVVTDVYWDNGTNSLKKVVRSLEVFGYLRRAVDLAVIEGTECAA